MNLKCKYYAIVWAVSTVLFNVIVFLTPSEVGGVSKYVGAFWVGYIFIMLVLLAQLGIAWFALKDDIVKTFYKIPLIRITYGTLFAVLLLGGLCMAIPKFPVWLGTILCIIVLGISIVSLTQAQMASSVVSNIDEKIKNKTFFIKSLTVDLNSLLEHSSTPEIHNEVKKLYEAVRYSDPMSNEALSGIEAEISIRVNHVAEAVETGDTEQVQKLTKDTLILINNRNQKCKLLK